MHILSTDKYRCTYDLDALSTSSTRDNHFADFFTTYIFTQ